MLLGFDAREAGGGGEWDEKRRGDFLFRPDVARPCSIDQRVWRPAVEAPASPSGFWEDLALLQEAIRQKPERPWIIALAVEPFEPVDARWEFLGYDVADSGGSISGLMNCGFLPGHEDVAALRARWGPRLNSWHLFDELTDAAAFKDFSDHRVPEHKPFFVNGLWRLREP